MIPPVGVFGWALIASFAMLSVSIVVAFVRLLIGPTLPDRVVALDLTALLVVAFIAVYSVAAAQPAFLDVAIVLALIAFLGTVAFARYLEKKGVDDD